MKADCKSLTRLSQRRKDPEGILLMHKYLKCRRQEGGARLFMVVPSDRMRSSDHKLKQRKFPHSMRKNFFMLRVAKPWDRLPKEVMESPSLEPFKTHLSMFLCHLL